MEIIEFDELSFPQVQRIYGEGLATGIATFETQIPSWESWDCSHMKIGRIAVMEDEHMLGWASLSAVSNRCVYGGVAEVSVYVGADSRGKGIGKRLLQHLIETSEANNIWTLQAGIFKENTASQVLHKTCGFREIGYREKIGQLKGVWKDNVLLERRSKVVGT
jgi:phosphinothricin acetyltransferase